MEEGEPPGYSTPSERWTSGLRRFFALGPLDGVQLARTVWLIALVVYAVYFVFAASAIPSVVAGLRMQDQPSTIVFFVAPVLMRLVEAVLWLLVIRLVIEVCLRLLGTAERR